MPLLNTANALFLGGSTVSRLYAGTNVIWQPGAVGPTTPPSWIAASSHVTNTFGVGSMNVPNPGGVLNNHIVLLHLYMEPASNNLTNAAALGFAEITPAAVASNHNQRVYWKRSTGSEPANYGLTFSATNAWVAAITSNYAGCITTGSPIDATAQATNSGTTSTPPISLTTNGDQRLLVWSSGDFDGDATWPTGSFSPYTRRSSGGNLAIATRTFAPGATGGSSGSFSMTSVGTDAKSARLIALIPAA